MKKVLLFNPPSGYSHFGRDYYCSKILKGNYIEQPIDLLILSGLLYSSFNISVLDATMDGFGQKQTLKRIRVIAPEIIIFISGLASWIDDFSFMKQLKKENKNLTIIGIGDIFWEKEVFLYNEWLDAVLFDFTSQDLLKYLKGEHYGLKNIIFRDGGKIHNTDLIKYQGEEFEIPVPRHDLFLNKRYTFPFIKDLPFTTVLTDYGCHFQCSFCIYGSLGFKARKVDNVFEELQYIHRLGIKEIFIKDQTFGYDKKRTLRLCKEMVRKRFNFAWTAFTRADLIDKEILSDMKEAGCHTLIFGIETADKDFLKQDKCGLTKEKIYQAFKLCRKMNIKTVGTFIIGLPRENKDDILRTINFAVGLKCDFASFNVFVPKPNTQASREFLKNNQSSDIHSRQWDQSGLTSLSCNEILTNKDIANLLCLAIRRFYFRPRYIFYRIIMVRSLVEFRLLIRNGIGLIRNFVRSARNEN